MSGTDAPASGAGEDRADGPITVSDVHALSETRKNIICLVHGLESREGTAPGAKDVAEESEALGMPIPENTIRTTISTLAGDGLLEVEQDPDDGRRYYYSVAVDVRTAMASYVETRALLLDLEVTRGDR